MKLLIWGGTALVVILWTLTIAVAASIANWLAGSGDQAIGGLQALSQWPTPAWLGLWVDPSLLAPIKSMVAWSLDLMMVAMPWLTPLLGWVAPLLWVVWSIGLVLLLVLALGGHLVTARLRPGTRARA